MKRWFNHLINGVTLLLRDKLLDRSNCTEIVIYYRHKEKKHELCVCAFIVSTCNVCDVISHQLRIDRVLKPLGHHWLALSSPSSFQALPRQASLSAPIATSRHGHSTATETQSQTLFLHYYKIFGSNLFYRTSTFLISGLRLRHCLSSIVLLRSINDWKPDNGIVLLLLPLLFVVDAEKNLSKE